MRLLIVDDESEIREGLTDTIDWRQIGINDVVTAKNGIEAVKVIQKSVPDIVLTDIRMPGMDGLELSDYIRNTYPRTKIFLISGYADFSYAKQAISIGVEEYLIKPVNVDELLQKISKAVNSIKLENSAGSIDDKRSGEVESFLSGILDNTASSPANYAVILNSFGFRWDKPYQSTILFEIDDYSSFIVNPPIKLTDLRMMLADRLSHMSSFEIIPFSDSMVKYIAFFVNIRNPEEYSKLIKEFPDKIYGVGSITSKYNLSLTTSISRLYPQNDFKRAYSNAADTLKHKFFIGKGVFLLSPQFENKTYENPISPEAIKEDLIKTIRLGDAEKCLALLQPLFKSYRFASTDKIDTIKENFLKIVVVLSSESCKLSKSAYEGNILQLGYNQYVEKFETIEEFIKQVEIFYCDIIEILKQRQATKSKWILEKAKEYMKKNFVEDLTVEEIANHVERNPNYFCHLFSNIEGIPITEYLNKLRIEKAKELLKTTSLMSYEIAEKVGFKNYRYFTQVFKKFVVKSPMSYRNDALSQYKNSLTN